MAINIKQSDIEWVLNRYPNLEYDPIKKQFSGEVKIKRVYQKIKISDFYHLKISLEKLDSSTGLPIVTCTDKKIEKIAQKHKIKTEDLHVNPDGSFCLTIKGQEQKFFKNQFTIQEFFINALEGFLYQISYFNQYGKFPWGEYAHGYLGFIEQFINEELDIEELLSNLSKKELIKLLLTNRQSLCLCGSQKKLRHCHPLVFQGIQKLKRSIPS